MPSPTTAGALVQSSLRLIGAIATGETPTAAELTDGLSAFNDLLELLSTSNLAVYGSAVEVFPTVGGQGVYTIGPGGNWATTRPVRIQGDAVCTYQGVDFPVPQWGQGEYDAVALKTQQQPIVERLLYVNDSPLGRITLWPVPSQVVNITINTDRILTAVTDTSTAVSMPPGYTLMFKHLLAPMLAPDYGITVDPNIIAIGTSALAAIKRANKTKREMSFDAGLVGPGVAIYQTGD